MDPRLRGDDGKLSLREIYKTTPETMNNTAANTVIPAVFRRESTLNRYADINRAIFFARQHINKHRVVSFSLLTKPVNQVDPRLRGDDGEFSLREI